MTIHRFSSNVILISSLSVSVTLTKVGKSIMLDVTDKFISTTSNVTLTQRQKDQLRQALCRIQLSNAKAVTFLQETGL